MNDSTPQSTDKAVQAWVYSLGGWSLVEDPVLNRPGAENDLSAGIKAGGYTVWTGVGKDYTMPLTLTVYSRLREPCYLAPVSYL
ncbi:hypothetical protein [Streptomyces sp. Wh19]|uniref:hypothetical protein n=1 Tax=Streptomyces sp. Wh19 TaxID=3076629 RepID=UPI002958A034|nr:hypothetical protein [Streptomyces sp. Wh19]MDV9199823.1 hypothetical protein [Streptomyces sp. Wh19]